MRKLNWGLLAAGNIAKTFTRGVQHSALGQVAAVASRTANQADAFAKEFEIPEAHDTYEALLNNPNVDAVYISTPHPMHLEWIVQATKAGKHVLCEKPITLNRAEAMVAAEAARANDVLLMEAFMYRCHPYITKLKELLAGEIIGEIRLIRAAFSFQAGFNPESRLFSNQLGGGGILDVGCYTTSMVRLIAGQASGRPFASPTSLTGTGKLLETGVDGWATASLAFESGMLAQLSTGVLLSEDNGVTIFGSKGSIRLPDCWIPSRDGSSYTFYLKAHGQPETPIVVEAGKWLYSLEADAFATALFEGKRSVPEMPIEDSLDNMHTLDRWRQAIGLTYESENPSNTFPTLTRRPLQKSSKSSVPTGRINGVDKEVSKLVMGCDNQTTMSHAAAVFDDFFERGGNAFDTAYGYGGGRQEVLLGHWIKSRNLRDQVFILGKGIHTPMCEPRYIEPQLDETLKRLQTDHVDLYLMHRDNPNFPAGEFVAELNRMVQKGKMKAFGGSNWSIARAEEANQFARDNGLQGFTALSNNLSLAHMVDPVWQGCVSASDDLSKAWLTKSGVALFAWSSQARGFFTDRAGRELRSDEELVRCWYSDDNFIRRERALELANAKNTTAINIALAFVLHQPFPAFALVGPRVISETVSCFSGTGVTLTPEEVAWLNLSS